MEFQHLYLFLDVARQGSFAAVARDRDLDPSSVSRAIAALEKELDVRLFQRSTRQMRLTEAGAAYRDRIQPVLEGLIEAGDAVRTLGLHPTGELRLTASVAFGQTVLTPLLPTLCAAFPDIRWTFLFTDENLDLVKDRIDLAVRLAPHLEGDVTGRRLFPTRYRVVAGPAYLAENPIHNPQDLSHHPCLCFSLPRYRNQWLFRNQNDRVMEVPILKSIIISSALSLKSCAIAGMGPALLADWLIDDALQSGELVDLFPTYQVTATEFETAAWLIYPSRSYLPNKVRATMDMLLSLIH